MIEQDISKTTNYITNLRINIHHGSSLGHLSWGRRLSNSIWANRINLHKLQCIRFEVPQAQFHQHPPQIHYGPHVPHALFGKMPMLVAKLPTVHGVEAQLYMDMMEKFQLFAGKNQLFVCQKKSSPPEPFKLPLSSPIPSHTSWSIGFPTMGLSWLIRIPMKNQCGLPCFINGIFFPTLSLTLSPP